MTIAKYTDYYDSGLAWLGAVPKCWSLKRLGHFFSERREKVSDKEFQPLSVTKNGIVPRLETAAKTQDGDNRKRVIAGDFVINSRSDRKGSSGLSGLDGSVSLICIVLEPDGIHGRFAHHLLRSEVFQEEFYRNGKGIVADLWSTGFSEMKNIVIPVPSLHEQTQIARFLDHETAKIDALIREQERLIVLLQEKRQALISHAVTKGLDPDVPMKDSGVEWLGEVPAHWQRSTIKRIATIRYGIGEPPRYQDSGTPLIRATNVDHGTLTPKGMVFVDPKDIPQKRIVWLKRDDILVVRSGAYTGDSAIVTEEYLPAIAGFDMVLRDISCNPMFLQLALLSSYMKGNQIDLEKMRAAQPHLNAEELGSCFLFLPPSEEQGEIVDRINNKTANLDALIEQATSTVGLLKERRSALVSAAVTGKIDVRNWEPPADESAFNEEVRQAGMEANA